MALPQPIKTVNSILGDFFKQPKPLISVNDVGILRKDTIVWKLRSDTFSRLTQGEKWEYTLWPFPVQSENYPFFLSFAMTLEANDDIKDVSIKIFREDVSQPMENGFIPADLLLRAEWSNEKPETNSARVHAQPHWHVHAYQVVDKMGHLPPEEQKTILELIEGGRKQVISILDEKMEAPAELIPAPEKNEIPMFRFHLAMVADWHKEKNDLRNKILDDATLNIWLPQCLGYIQEQLEYILEKLPKIR